MDVNDLKVSNLIIKNLSQVEKDESNCGSYIYKDESSPSVLIKQIDNLRKIILEFERSEDDDEIEERRIQAGVILENVKKLLNGLSIAVYDSAKQQPYLLSRDGTKKYLDDD